MNTMPIVDLRISSASSRVNRMQTSAQAEEGADFSKTFQESLSAISRENEASVSTDGPVQKRPTRVRDKNEHEPRDDSHGGQNVPAAAAVVPADVAGMMPLSALGPEAIETALRSATAAKGATSAGMATDQAVLVQAMAAAADGADKGPVSLGHLKLPVTNMPTKAERNALVPIGAEGELSAGAVGSHVAGPAGGEAAAQALVVADDGASANQALLQEQVAQSTAVPILRQTSELALAQADVMAKAGEATEGVASVVSVGARRESADLPMQGAAELTFADKALASTVLAQATSLGSVSAEFVSEPPLALDARLTLPVAKDDAVGSVGDTPGPAQADDAVPLGGLGAGLPGNQIGGAASSSTSVAPPVAPAVMVPAAHLNHELVKFAGAGGGRAVMEITSPDLGVLKIDLSIDGKGVARMVVEASTGAARDQLEQGMRQLHDDFAGLGLSLNVDLRQGGGSGYQRDSATDAWGPGTKGVASAAAGRGSSVAIEAGAARLADEKSRVHFYA